MDASRFFDENQKLLALLGFRPSMKWVFIRDYSRADEKTFSDLKRLCDDAKRAAGGDEIAQSRIQMGAPEPQAANPKSSRLFRMDL
jgi:hypothetical protein